ncbi:N-acetylmuramoyl-L-alanine amidase [Krasilnikovia sp. MM14-A1004]|uniref:N-acetylmuramoyl-L-alanine amidase n=1 Tax=Krasilnikovia sp. MM14-A1004 TaxID=3373541 RepID=UPI00399D1184
MNRRQVIGVLASTAVVAVGTTVIALHRPGASSHPAAAAEPVVALPAAEPAAAPEGPPVRVGRHTLDIAPADSRAHTLKVPERRTDRFSLLGITWTDPAARVSGTVQVRTRAVATGAWSPWRTLDSDDSLGPDTAAERGGHPRGGTAPLWVGPADGVAARVVDAAGAVSRALPAGLRLELLDSTGDSRGAGGGGQSSGGQGGGDEVTDPTSAPAIQPSATQETSAPPAPAAPTSTAPAPVVTSAAPAKPATTKAAPRQALRAPLPGGLPPYVSRAGWQADESLVKNAPDYAGNVGVLFVHHTAGTNDYQCADSPSIVRGILAYHVQSQHWNDIGYNFLTDKCGTLFEGRKGGVDKPVIGAHTYGFNTGSAAVAVLGTYIKDRVPAATQTTIAQLAAYKLGMYGFAPTSSTKLTEGVSDGKFPKGTVVTFARISGHRDGVATECPGDALYAQLADIRTEADAGIYGLTAKPGGAGVSGGIYYARGPVTMTWSIGNPSTVLTRFEVLVDGAVAATAAPADRSATVPVSAGTHKLQVRAVRDNGSTGISTASTVLGDTTAPTFPGAPAVVLRGGTVSATSVPVTLTFRAADNAKLASVALTAPSARTFGPTTTSWATAVKPGGTIWRLSARDVAGNTGGAAVGRTVVLLPETNAKRGGKWGSASKSAYLGGKALTSGTRNAKLTWTFTGSSAALLFARTAKSGKVDVYLDGRKVGTLDLRAGKNSYRQALWTRAFAKGRHTVAIVVRGTGGRPTVTSDGLAYLR